MKGILEKLKLNDIDFTKFDKLSNYFSNIVVILSLTAIITFGISNYVTSNISPRSSILSYQEDAENADTIDEINGNFSEVEVQKGDTLSRIFGLQDLSNNDCYGMILALKKSKIKFSLKPGQKVTFDYEIDNSEDNLSKYALKEVNIVLDKYRSILISKNADNSFTIKDIKAELSKKYVKHEVTIDNSFVSSLSRLGIGANNIQDLVNAYSYTVDFQRQIKRGDSIKLLCEKFYTADGEFVHSGKILFASLKLSNKSHEIFWFKAPNEKYGHYYAADGKSVKRGLLRTPLDVVRISSKFGMRKHPVLGYTKMHKGVDFAGPTGTPIKAAGDGVVLEKGYKGAYGNFISIRHNASTVTAYAHASRFAKNIKRGSFVKQGQIIAYVGATGRSTGPHCHFEVRINGKHVNPMTVHSAPGEPLSKEKLNLFKKQKESLIKYTKISDEGKPFDIAKLTLSS